MRNGSVVSKAPPKILSGISLLIALILNVTTLAGCSPEVGSDAWCEKLKKTHKADWSSRDASAYAKHCIFK